MNTKFYFFARCFLLAFIFSLTTFIASAQQPKTKSWGFNTYGQLGSESLIISTNTPDDSFNNFKDITSITGGGLHTLALRANGTVLAVGYNPYGQLGNGANATTGCSCELMPLQVINPENTGNLSNITNISAGGTFSLALNSDGRVYAWGNNSNGELGTNNNVNRNLPVQVGSNIAGFDGQVVAIDAGFLHSLALTRDGRVWAWGFNNSRQLGDGSAVSQNSPKPVLIATGASQLSEVIQIAAGAFHSVALKKDGTVLVWGSNNNRQVGNPAITGSFAPFPTETKRDISGPVVRIAAGAYHNLALRGDGTVWVWGRNFEAQLGNGTNSSESITEPTQNISLANVIEINSDDSYHNLVRSRDGKVLAWGNNAEGESGMGTFLDFQPTPSELTTLGLDTTIIGTGVYNSYAVTPQILTETNNQIIRGENFSVFFSGVVSAGETIITPIDPTTTGLNVPANYTIEENQPAYKFSTTAALTGNTRVCLKVPNEFDEMRFADLKVLQSIGADLVDRTSSSDYPRQQICAEVTSLSSFVIAGREVVTPTIVSVSGRVLSGRGRTISYARVNIQDSNGNIRTTETNLFGNFKFEDVVAGQNYTISVFARGLSFAPQTITVNQDITDLVFNAN